MTDVMITSAAAEEAKIDGPADQATARDVESVVAPPEPAAPTLDESTVKLLAELGFDHVPTVEEAKAALDARRKLIREEVLFQADRKHWCEEGTRAVCANLRLHRPGSREARAVKVRATVEYTVQLTTYSAKGALHQAQGSGYLPVGTRFVGAELHSAEIHELAVDGESITLDDTLREEIING